MPDRSAAHVFACGSGPGALAVACGGRF